MLGYQLSDDFKSLSCVKDSEKSQLEAFPPVQDGQIPPSSSSNDLLRRSGPISPRICSPSLPIHCLPKTRKQWKNYKKEQSKSFPRLEATLISIISVNVS
eukprot:Lithocolla_globosa_v1_NODE_136_length_5835_cov_11.826644.p14 type:complete len:100 gc:universal NODE_136_length_5835_cov_11.826644:3061-2762(-)